MSVSLKEIAQALGVSVATVSRVASGQGVVREETRLRVEEAMRSMGYAPNLVARSLKTRSTRTVGILVPDITESFFGGIIKSAVRTLEARGYGILLCDTDESREKEAFYLESLVRQRVDGVILASLGADEGVFSRLRDASIAVTQIDTLSTDTESAVLIDNRAAGVMGAEYLLSRGYRRIGVIVGSQREYTGRLRLAGTLTACRRGGAEPTVREGDFKEASGYTAALSLLDETDPPDALFIHSSKMTYGAIKALRERGIRYPGDIALLGFDLPDPFQAMSPGVSSIVQPEVEIGATAAELLLWRIAGKPCMTRFLEPVLLERESCR
ncbi:MAG: LacI family DNA-binding transcriptional regulator [Clostridiaceae bacterium]|nr:LacI family DNA-binding transcriptional regulator [Clostridiaceae bacterium]